MAIKNKKVELLAPAGNFEKLEIAIHYGADAVYLAGKDFSLRNLSENFTIDELYLAVQYAHKHDVKIYVTCNIFPRNYEQDAIKGYLKKLGDIGPDALIIADPGTIMAASTIVPHIPIHLSTQANTTNYQSALFWKNLGVKRINIARELSLKEIKEIALRCPMELEAFVHGAMCISYSGRCLLSSFLANRDSNRGLCSHPCRWKYTVLEEFRPGQYMPIVEDDRGSYIFNSKDLCMIENIPEMIESGLASLKIEGRIKGINYLASTVKVYREAIDVYFENPADFSVKKDWVQELSKINSRGYCTGFYFGNPHQTSPFFEGEKNNSQPFVGKVIGKADNFGVKVDVRNRIVKGEPVEILKRKGSVRNDKIREILDEYGQPLPSARPGSTVILKLENHYAPNDLIRRSRATPHPLQASKSLK